MCSIVTGSQQFSIEEISRYLLYTGNKLSMQYLIFVSTSDLDPDIKGAEKSANLDKKTMKLIFFFAMVGGVTIS